eukprot:1061923-Rhodomonas_salina.1
MRTRVCARVRVGVHACAPVHTACANVRVRARFGGAGCQKKRRQYPDSGSGDLHCVGLSPAHAHPPQHGQSRTGHVRSET